MIYETLEILRQQLEDYFLKIGFHKEIKLGNAALWESGDESAEELSDKLIVTLLRIEEEPTLKNAPHFKINGDKTEYRNPPINLHLYVLISANLKEYDQSLRGISKVIEFFQGKNVYTSTNTVYDRDNVSFELLDYFKLILDLYSPKFEELNNIWGMLGGKQLPSVLYKLQLIQIKRDQKLFESGIITEIKGTLKNINQ